MSNNYQQNQHQSNNNLVLNKLSSLPLLSKQVSSSAASSPKKSSLQLLANNAAKRPLSTSNTNIFHNNLNAVEQHHSSPRKTLLNGNLIAKAKTILAEKPQLLIDNYELNDESLRNNVQIVLQNINQNFQHNNHHGQAISLNDLHFLTSDSCGSFIAGAAAATAIMSSSPESDCNSNPTTQQFAPPNPTYYLQPMQQMMPIDTSVASSQDFTHDNLDYQWCPDYGYRDSMAQQHQSVLSSLFSYSGIGELSYYEDLAKNIDANLAEVDMESFRAEDIHSLLTNLPTICSQQQQQQDNDAENHRQKMSLHDLDSSICKSELLFSPVKESHISVDSLDMEGYPDDENIILTCKANKDNYTIAFEGSAMYSDDSFYGEFKSFYFIF